MPTPITYFPYSLSLITRLEKSESPDSRMTVPISGRVKTSSRASMASRMSVAFFFDDPYAGAKIRSMDASESGTMYCGYRRQSAYARWTATFPLMISDESRLRSSLPRSERIPIVTLSKSMRSAALGACIGVEYCGAAVMACGPRWMSAVCAREGVCECREFMQGSADQKGQFRPLAGVKPFRVGGWPWDRRSPNGEGGSASGDMSVVSLPSP